jgi:hypothetical protein
MQSSLVLPPVLTKEPATRLPARVDEWVEEQVRFYADEYTKFEPVTAAICSFNVADRPPPPNLSFVTHGASSPDIVVVGLQEVDMSASALLREETESAVPWVKLAGR